MNHVYFLAKKAEEGWDHTRCYDAVNLIGEGRISLGSRLRPLSMETKQIRMDCLLDPDKTIFPGAETIIYFSDGSEPARVIYLGDRRHRLVWGRVELEVRYRQQRWKFFLEGKHLASMIQSDSTEPVLALTESRWVPRYTMMSCSTLPEPLALLMLHFPLLQIAP